MRLIAFLTALLFLAAPAAPVDEHCFRLGDVDGDGSVCGTPVDVIYLANYLYRGGDAPPCMAAADIDGNGALEITDVVLLMNICFGGWQAPPGFCSCEFQESPLSCFSSVCQCWK